MKHEEFSRGLLFYTGAGTWVCTDVGSRTIIAVKKVAIEAWPKGPPYAVGESVFDEYDQLGCTLDPKGLSGLEAFTPVVRDRAAQDRYKK